MGPLASPYPWRCPRNGDESGPRILPCSQLPAPIIPEVVPGPGGVQGWTPPCECSSSPAPSTPSSPIPTDVMASVSRSLLSPPVTRRTRFGNSQDSKLTLRTVLSSEASYANVYGPGPAALLVLPTRPGDALQAGGFHIMNDARLLSSHIQV
ncbi:hypothetical protein Anapl_14590 [Anas platyrhynchos]|uniref:Uncharacterized protein n=1 Tax=Anas platyrhynchos TaxID=8839 RepID=R0L0C5_ANAPL|nr:hypothetical protein Anapl_14590 [Anas platyrhynchos]